MTRAPWGRAAAAAARHQRLLGLGVAAALLLGLLAGTGAANPAGPDDGRLRVVVTTPIIADLVRNVGGTHVRVSSLVPDQADPHSYEPTLRSVRDVVYADVAFSNYLMLEQHAIIRTLDANLRPGVPNVSLAEGSSTYGAQLIPLVENVSLETIWLGARAIGTGSALGGSRTSSARLYATGADGPGDLTAYLTETFGNPRVYVASKDGFDAGDGYAADGIELPAAAHTHMSWAFSKPGVYHLDVRGELLPGDGARPVPRGQARLTFAVGVNPHEVPGATGARVLSTGHADVAVDLDAGRVVIRADEGGRTEHLDPARVVIEVPAKALTPTPGEPEFRFLGRAGDPVYLLPQAVLGKHVHGEVDPHLWQDVRNAKAYVKLIAETLAGADPGHAADYHANAAAYLRTLDATDAFARTAIGSVPRSRRYLVTTHDAFGYLAKAYEIPVAGFVTPNPSTEPSAAERTRLQRTLRDLGIRAVFLEPNLAGRSPVLRTVAEEAGVQVCRIYGDAFDREVRTYVQLVRANATSIAQCLGGRVPQGDQP